MDSIQINSDSRISHLSLSARVHQTLRAWLSGGELEPGQKMTGRILAEKLGVSQTPVREALLQLVAEHALTMNPNRSITVPMLSRDKFIELRDMRVALEGLAARCAALRCTTEEIDAIEKMHRDMMIAKQSGDFKNTLRLNRQIHFAVCEMSQREELFAVIQSLWARTGPYLNFSIVKTSLHRQPPIHTKNSFGHFEHITRQWLKKRLRKTSLKAVQISSDVCLFPPRLRSPVKPYAQSITPRAMAGIPAIAYEVRRPKARRIVIRIRTR
jgi:DNA-binding GntR family transcriptional regulator